MRILSIITAKWQVNQVSKLQEIKRFVSGSKELGYSSVVCDIESVSWLIEQLEQEQAAAKRWEKAFDNADKQYLKKEKEAAELKRKLEQAQATMQWQPLETIPKDGTNILVLDADGSVYEASWNGWGWDYPRADQHGCGCCAGDKGEPVKWMNLPNTEIEVKGNVGDS